MKAAKSPLAAMMMAAMLPVAHADLVMTGLSTAGMANMPLSSQEKIWLRNTTIRRDFVDRGRAYTHLFDLAQHQAAIIDHVTRIAEVHDLNKMQMETEISAPLQGLKMTVKKSGNAKPLKHWNCEEHTLSASMPARLGNEETIFHLSGRLWVASKVKEQSEIRELVRRAKMPEFFIGIPAIARISPAQAAAISELVRRIAPKGLLCEGTMDMSHEGNGPMANLAKRIPARLGIIFQDFSTDPIPEGVFSIPGSYQIVRK